MEFLGGVVYGIFVPLAFFYAILIGLARYAETHGALPREDSIDGVIWFLESLGFVRILAYVLIALAWPLLLALVVICWALLRKYESIEEVPQKMRRRIDWVALGFGKFV